MLCARLERNRVRRDRVTRHVPVQRAWNRTQKPLHPKNCSHAGLVNGGSFRLNRNIVENEPITKGVVCDLLFHSNDIRIYTMAGAAIRRVIERCHQVFRDHGNFLQISGLDVEVRGGTPRILVGADGKFAVLDDGKAYSVATTAYLATKKEAYGEIFDRCGPPQIVESSIRDAVEAELLAQLPASPFSNTARWH
jgi:2',3'-cyclic-nucleotide 2'-phosphodiesterase (5'-nucleotidase family)